MIWSSRSLVEILAWACIAGGACALFGALGFFRSSREDAAGRIGLILTRLSTFALAGGALLGVAVLWVRYLEVNHFPSQTMHEVVTFFCVATLVSGLVLRWVLRWHRYGAGAEGLGYLLQALVLGGVAAVLLYTAAMPSTERDLPPALQSYWFPPHLTSLIFSYGTLSIAALLAFLYFGFQAARGIFEGQASAGSLWGTLAFIFLVPFSHFVTVPLFLLVVLPVAYYLHASGKGFAWLPDWGNTLDELSFRIFAVGFPFLTAGLMMGALWAQESWANYWGWDSKEVTALITWFVYLVYLHLRFVVGWRGPKSMKVLLAGAISIFITFQLFGYLPDSQKSLHRYTDPDVVPAEGMQGN